MPDRRSVRKVSPLARASDSGDCPREGRASHVRPEGGTAWWCNWNTYRGTVAHELGHTFGLPHPDAFRPGFRFDSTVITNMQCHWAWPADSLLPFESAHLPTLPAFSHGALSEWTPARPVVRPDAPQPHHHGSATGGADMLWLAGRGNGTGYLWGYRIEGGGDRAFTVEWKVPPAGTRAFVADLGLPNGQRMQVSYRFECGTAIAEGLLGPDDPPRTITLPVSECVLTVSASAPIGVGNPRWSRTAG